MLRGGKLTFRTLDTSRICPPQRRRQIYVQEAEHPRYSQLSEGLNSPKVAE